MLGAQHGLTNSILRIMFFLLIIGIMHMAARSETITVKYAFEYPEMSAVMIGDKIYDQVSISGLTNSGQAGEPNLPVKDAHILVPFGSEVVDIQAVASRRIKIDGNFFVEPTQKAYPISIDPLTINPEESKENIYKSIYPYPSNRIERVAVQTFRGYRILVLNLYPVEYIPSRRELFYYPEITINIQTQESDNKSNLYRGLDIDSEEIKARIDNAGALLSYGNTQHKATKSYELLIITTSILQEYFLPLKDYHDTTGILTDLLTIEQIGANDPDIIRDYIKDRYLNDGIEYVLIGGDDDVISAKDLYVEAWSYVENIPADLYFGCLDGTFNYDGDSRWGEPTDGEGGGDVDLMAEVFVGRAPVGTPAEAYTFAEKTIRYLNSNHAYLSKSLLVGEELGHPGIQQYGAYLLAKLIDSSSSNGYRTIGIPSNLYSIDSLYDRDWPGHYWPASEIIARINAEQHFINHMGHSNATFNMKLTPADIGLLNNDNLALIYSQGCFAGSFDSANDCMAEQFTVKTSSGAFAALMNARYGWKEFFKHVNTTDGPNQRFQREFWDAIFNPEEDMPELGRANQDSKEDNLYRINEGAMRWVYYQMNLFGDPTVRFKRFTSLAFEFPSGLPLIGAANQQTVFEMTVTGIYGGTPVAASGQLHYSINGEEFQTTSLTELSLNNYEVILPAIGCDDAIELYFSAEEAQRGRIYYPRPDSPFVFAVIDSVVTIFSDDFESANNWTVTGGQWNRGLPTGGGGEYGRPDPTEGFNGPNVYGYNLNGDYDNSISAVHLISPSIDCSNFENVILNFRRWLNVEETPYDYATVSVSNDNLNWSTVWQNVGFIMDSAWIEVELDMTEFAANQDSVYLRWTMGPTNTAWRYSGWNIDDVEVVSVICNEETFMCGDANGDETVNILDITYMISYLYKDGSPPDPLEAADVNNSGDVNILDITYLIANLYKGGPEPNCP